jgi:predicted transposase/invertase (TIGR01784 family)
MADEKDIGEYVEELALYIDSTAPGDLKGKVLEKIRTSIITGEKKMSSIKEYFKQEGLKEGFEKGFKQGDEHGFKQGTEKGIKQGIELVALNMLKKGESTEKVALYTGLSEEKIASLRKRLNEKQ